MRFTKSLQFDGETFIEKPCIIRSAMTSKLTPMRNLIHFLTLVSLSFSVFPVKLVGASSDSKPEDNSGAIVCSPDAYIQPPDGCLPLGPSEYLTELAHLGMTLPIRSLDEGPADPGLRELPYLYYKVDPTTGTGFYPSLDAAQDKSGAERIIPPGTIIYVVYSSRNDTKRGTYFQLPSGSWMPGDGSTVSLPQYQPGVEFHSTPPNAFGWILEPETPVRSQPNFLPDNQPVRMLPLYDVVQVFSKQNVEGNEWILIGPGAWVEGRQIAAVSPNTTPPDGVTNGRWIDVDLAQQTLAVYDNQQLVFATVMASGLEPTWTRPGLFQIYQKKELETMSGDQGTSEYYYLEDVPWTMYFDKARALHGAYWRARLGYAQSHGCVNLTIGDAHWLFNWAHEGDWVYVHDPSGLTPTDDASYGDGGGS
jgi:lipoprotein-anchoring transpeptidase ErfK/SrfK